MNIHPEMKYSLFNMLVSFSDIYQFVFEAIKIFTGGVLEGTIPLSLSRLRTTDSTLFSLNLISFAHTKSVMLSRPHSILQCGVLSGQHCVNLQLSLWLEQKKTKSNAIF